MSDELPDIPDVGRYVFTDNFLENVWTPHNRYQLSPTLLFLSILYIGCKDGLGLYFNQSSLLFKKILSKSFQRHLIWVKVLNTECKTNN